MLLLIQSWLVLTVGLLTVLAVIVGLQGLVRAVRRPADAAPAATSGRPTLRLVQS